MLISFSVGNFRSIKDPVTLSMEIEHRIKGLEKENFVKKTNDLELLNIAAIYGANASGKTNIGKALQFMRYMVIHSAKDSQKDEPIAVERFLLSTETQKQPSMFDIFLLIDGIKYNYGFKATSKEIVEEWLSYWPKTRKTPLFHRKNNKIKQISKSQFAEGLDIEKRTRPNALFLSTVAQWNGGISGKLVNAISLINVLRGFNPESFEEVTETFLNNKKYVPEINDFLCGLDLAIKQVDYEVKPLFEPDALKKIPKELLDLIKSTGDENAKTVNVKTMHNDSDNNLVPLNLKRHESHGTQKLFALAGPIVDTISKGQTLFVDEIDSRIHPLLTIELIRMFQTDKSNKNNAQLVFTTHDSSLLSRRVNLLRRDQIWFTEKRQDESTDLYSLIEFAPRNDEALDINYLRGKYGAIPLVSGFASLFGDKHGK